MIYLVTDTNALKKERKNVKCITWAEFCTICGGANHPFNENDLYIDCELMDNSGNVDMIEENIPAVKWVSFNDSKIPESFTRTISDLPDELNPESLDEESTLAIGSAVALMSDDNDDSNDGEKIGRIVTFGSAKGGSGKTFTSIITAVYYAKDHPNQRVCLLDLDVEEPQVGLVIKKTTPNVKKFYGEYCLGDTSFDTLKRCRIKGSEIPKMPKNLDFYISPRDANPILDKKFWETIMVNLFYNYDMIILDTGTTYMQTEPIISAYKIADKICIVTMASLASSVAVKNQINRLTGEYINNIYSEEDDIESKINIIVTNYNKDDKVTNILVKTLANEAPIIATFGYLHEKINKVQILGQWDLFDDNDAFRNGIRDIYA